jgi:N,N'-diacetyllegionaminate synthase
LSDDDHRWFLEECGRVGIKPLTTVYSRGRVPFLASLPWERYAGRRAIKVASFDCASYPLLGDLKASFEHLYVSTGATTDEELEQAAKVLQAHSVTFLHCVSIYPTPLERMNLRRIERLRKCASTVGFSDHWAGDSPDALKASICALALRATVIERHFTVLGRGATRDGPVSVDPTQLRALVGFARMEQGELERYIARDIPEYDAMLGDGSTALSERELTVRAYQRGRFASRVGVGVRYNWES